MHGTFFRKNVVAWRLRMLKKLYEWFIGFVFVELRGIYPERFMNLCSKRNIDLKKMSIRNNRYYAILTLPQYKKIRPIAKKAHCIPYVRKRIGFPFFWSRYKKRMLFIVGFLGAVCLFLGLSTRVWHISIRGGFVHTEEAMLSYLKEKNIVCGMNKKNLDCAALEKEIRITYTDIGWVSAELKGTKLFIRITETNLPQVREQVEQPSHMIAMSDGIVERIVTRTGTPLVKEGDVVKKGDILISGLVSIVGDNDTPLGTHAVIADGDVLLKTIYHYEHSFETTVTEKQKTGNQKTGFELYIGNYKIFSYTPRYFYIKYDIMKEDVYFKLSHNFILPFRKRTITYAEYEEIKRTYQKEEAQKFAEQCKQRYLQYLQEQNIVITDTEFTTTVSKQRCTTTGTIVAVCSAWEYAAVQTKEEEEEKPNEYSRSSDEYTNRTY